MKSLAYYGGKFLYAKRLADVILDHKKGERVYIEPFCGFCSVMKELMSRNAFEKYIASDANESLTLLLHETSRDKFIPSFVSSEEYEKLKSQKFPSALQGFAGFCFSFNNKFLRGYRNCSYNDDQIRTKIQKFLKSMKILRDVDISCKMYSEYENYEGCFFYLDPPYATRTDKYRNFDYKEISFDTDEFWEFARRLSKKNTVLVSEYSAPDDFECVYEFEGFHAMEKLFKLKTSV